MEMNVSLTDELAQFVKAKISTGRYASSSDLVRDALHLMATIERQEADRLRMLREAWADGIDSGDAGEIDFDALKAEARARQAATA